ncbi:MAG TPA: beta-ketoacyl-[acyl-carrier-protein] synthase family protein [Thermoanaerobaculia bacterium]|nr:beta-ketoacyl-[acyl-carrier-protein] synthase family protein [Thermoanaerobaculia bacterium]
MRKADSEVRLAITGMGIICSIGRNQQEVWESITASRAGIGPMARFAGETFPTNLAAEAEADLYALIGGPRPALRRLSRTDLLALVAAREAIGQAAGEGSLPPATIVSSGSSTGGLLEGEDYYFKRMIRGAARTAPSSVLQQPTSSPSDAIARHFRLEGGVFSNATACASAGAAIGMAADMIRSGYADAAVAGGSDALCRLTYSGFNVLQAVDSEPCSPFGAERKGITLGEGAAYLVIERWGTARERGATILAELCGYGASCDAHHPTAPVEDGSGASQAMASAMTDRAGGSARIDYVNAHGTGTPLNDSAETRAIVTTLGTSVPTSSTKSFFGHTLGASGALEAVVTVLALQHQIAPPTLRLDQPGEDCCLDYIPHTPRAMLIEQALSNTFGFGGSNVSLLFREANGAK